MKTYIYALLLVGLLAACSDLKETVGLGRQTPDEFDVVNNPPLTIPPDFTLRPPERGQQTATGAVPAVSVAATAAGAPIQTDAVTSPGVAAFLSQANVADAKPDIRAQIDKESDGVVVKDKSFVDKLMVWQPSPTAPDPTLNDAAEAARVKAAQEKGGFVSGDGTQYDKPKDKAPLEGLLN
jgi:uncharacterized lipoprotein